MATNQTNFTINVNAPDPIPAALPDAWAPSSTIIEDWGRLQIMIGGIDRTFYRDVPTIVENWVSKDPFDDASCTLRFSGITSYESLEDLPFKDFDEVLINVIRPNGDYLTLWDGFIGSVTDELQATSSGVTVECLGTIYQLDLFIKPPAFGSYTGQEIGISIAAEINLRKKYYGMRFDKDLNPLPYTNYPSKSTGSWNKFLTGWVQESIAGAETPAYLGPNERAMAIQTANDGYWILGDYDSIISFGDRMPNYGSSRWFNGIFIDFGGNSKWKATDCFLYKDGQKGFSTNQLGTVARWGEEHHGTRESGQWWFPRNGVYTPRQWGGMDDTPLPGPIVAMQGTPDGNGYWLFSSFGNAYYFGSAINYGNASSLTTRTAQNGTVYHDFIVDAVVTETGHGYWMLGWNGTIYNFGDAEPYGPAPLIDNVFCAIDRTPDGTGIFVLDVNGRVTTFGSAVNYGSPGFSGAGLWTDLSVSVTGGGYACLRNDGYVATFGDQPNLGDARFIPDSNTGGKVHQFTLTKAPNLEIAYADRLTKKSTQKFPLLITKDTWTTHWTVTTGTPGVYHSLKRDRLEAPNTIYGEGTDLNNCKWRNSKHPNQYPVIPESGDTRDFPLGYSISIDKYNGMDALSTDATRDAIKRWQQSVKQMGYDIPIDGVYKAIDRSICMIIQRSMGYIERGTGVNGILDAIVWTACLQPYNAGNSATNGYTTIKPDYGSVYNQSGHAIQLQSNSYIAPLAVDRTVEPFYYLPNGAVNINIPFTGGGQNSASLLKNGKSMRVETYFNYGEKVSKLEGMISATNTLKTNADPGYVGTITLAIDPEEGSRFEIKAGQNILMKAFRGKDMLFHIAQADINFESGTATLTVDTKARDIISVGALINRERTSGDQTLQPTRKNSRAKLAADEVVVWDCESGAGYIPPHKAPVGVWYVIKVPAGEVGTVVKTEFETSPPTTYTIAVFDQPILENGVGDHLGVNMGLNDYTQMIKNNGNNLGIDDPDFWNSFPTDRGLIITWGGAGEKAGTYPIAYKDAVEPYSGKMVDASSWNFWSQQPPWIYVAIRVDGPTVISGRFYPGPDGGMGFTDIDTLAHPNYDNTVNNIFI